MGLLESARLTLWVSFSPIPSRTVLYYLDTSVVCRFDSSLAQSLIMHIESTALRTKRPLINLAIAELGKEEKKIEYELTKWFSLAEHWKAILLIEECDIFLERRDFADIARNGRVAAFLRKVEYFGGLLFLTTNRVGHIDEAFSKFISPMYHHVFIMPQSS